MNKYIFKSILCSALALTMTTSCELDQYPAGSIPSEGSWKTVEDADKFYKGLLISMRSVSGGSVNYVTEVQSDLFNHVLNDINCVREHDWTFTTNQFNGDGVWTGNYGMIMYANNILNNIDQVPYETKEDSAALSQIKGSAFLARAWAYSSMAVRYCVNYDSETAADALGLPIVKTVDVNAKPSRSSLQATYDQILADLDEADVRLADVNGDVTEPSADFAKALRARVYLNMKKYDEAIALCNDLIARYPLSTARTYSNIWWSDDAKESIYQPLLTNEERSGGTNGALFIGFSVVKQLYSPGYVPTQGLIDLYESSDVRKRAFFLQTTLCNNNNQGTGYMFNKFPGNEELLQGNENNTTTWYNMPKPFRIAEMYLIGAEASLMKDQPDEAAALKFLNDLRSKRSASTLSLSGDLLVREMKNEWIREFVGEGFRLNCLKRWGDGVVRMAPQASLKNTILEQDPLELSVKPGDPNYYKMIWEIPSQDLQANKNIVPNWKK